MQVKEIQVLSVTMKDISINVLNYQSESFHNQTFS